MENKYSAPAVRRKRLEFVVFSVKTTLNQRFYRKETE